MQYRNFGKLGIKSSAFGLGCMRFNGEPGELGPFDDKKAIELIHTAIDGGVTYIDTAYIYLDKTSETVVGRALQDGYREKVTIATKMPLEHVNNRADMEKLLDEELKKLQTDHIDFYLLHGINKDKWEKFKSIGAKEFLEDKKKEGKIRYKCFSFHASYDEFEYIIRDNDWDMCQIQYNFMDVNNQAGTKGLELAGSLGIPVVIMEGLLGGKLAKAPDNVQAIYDSFPVKRTPVEWAFRWLCNHPEVGTVLSGCNELEQVEDNLRIFDGTGIGVMTDDELALMDKVRDAYNSRTRIGCTGCRYCMPCPNGVNIPLTFAAWNDMSLYNTTKESCWPLHMLNESGATPDKCLQCGACEAACPQHIKIIDMLKTAWGEINA